MASKASNGFITPRIIVAGADNGIGKTTISTALWKVSKREDFSSIV
jgi:dethiobiotin synthetase